MKYNFEEIINELDKLKALDDKKGGLFVALMKHIAPDSHAPEIYDYYVPGFLRAFELINTEIADWLNYYVYERLIVTDADGINYDFSKKEDAIRFLNKEFNK